MSKTDNKTIWGPRPDSALQATLERIETLLTEIRATGTKPLDLDEAAVSLSVSLSFAFLKSIASSRSSSRPK